MEDKDLERKLRAEMGPRDAGYSARELPPALPDGGGRRSVRLVPRWALLGGAALAGALVVAVAGALGDHQSPADGPGAGGASPSLSATHAAVASVVPSDGSCPPASILLRPEPWGGAAGSRGTTLSIRLVDGADSCDLATSVSARILDGTGSVLVEGATVGTGSVRLSAGVVYQLSVSWSNWCDAAPQPELRWDLRFGPSSPWIDVAVEVSAASAGTPGSVPVPPCLGVGGTHLNVTPIELMP